MSVDNKRERNILSNRGRDVNKQVDSLSLSLSLSQNNNKWNRKTRKGGQGCRSRKHFFFFFIFSRIYFSLSPAAAVRRLESLGFEHLDMTNDSEIVSKLK